MREITKTLVDTVFKCDLKGKVITIIAPSGLGKTTFASIQLPIFIFSELKEKKELKKDSKFIIVNTDNSLLDERMEQVCNAFNVKYTDVRKHFVVSYCYDFTEQDSLVKTLFKQILEGEVSNVHYIVIDPFNQTLRREFAKAPEQYRLNIVGKLTPRLEYQLIMLNHLARKKGITVVLTLLPKKAYTQTVPPVWQSSYFGPLEIAHLSDIVLWFSKSIYAAQGVTINVKKHRTQPSEVTYQARITEGGLCLM